MNEMYHEPEMVGLRMRRRSKSASIEDQYYVLDVDVAAMFAEKDTRIGFLESALDQAIDAGSLRLVTVVKDKSYGMWNYEGEECIVGQSATENFFAGFPDGSPELTAYFRINEDINGAKEREN